MQYWHIIFRWLSVSLCNFTTHPNEPDSSSEHLFKFIKAFRILFGLTVLYALPPKVHLLIKSGMRKRTKVWKVKPRSPGNANIWTPESLYEWDYWLFGKDREYVIVSYLHFHPEMMFIVNWSPFLCFCAVYIS